MAAVAEKPTIVIRRVRKVAAGHHGGAWKVAYADFVTAMMAFFLVMWIVGIADKSTKAAISDYFKNPSAVVGKSLKPAPGAMGPGGAADKMIPTANAVATPGGIGPDFGRKADPMAAARGGSDEQDRARERERDRRQLEALRQQVTEAVDRSQALAPFKDQLLIDLTPEGLRIQIVDRLNRPMFDLGSVELKPYAEPLLRELGTLLQQGDHDIAISGHTDELPFHAPDGYGNWELSSDRANAARRALLRGGLAEARINRVVGLAASVPFNRNDPRDPVNRRISILVLNRDAAQRAPDTLQAAAPAPPATVAGGAPSEILRATVR